MHQWDLTRTNGEPALISESRSIGCSVI